jgi:hypothetical protein
MADEDLHLEIRALRREVERLNGHRFIAIHNSMARLLAFRFAQGLAVGLGTVIGATALVSVLAYALAQIDFLPILGEWARILAEEIGAELREDPAPIP